LHGFNQKWKKLFKFYLKFLHNIFLENPCIFSRIDLWPQTEGHNDEATSLGVPEERKGSGNGQSIRSNTTSSSFPRYKIYMAHEIHMAHEFQNTQLRMLFGTKTDITTM